MMSNEVSIGNYSRYKMDNINKNLNQEICDKYLVCPACHGIGSLKLSNKNEITCNQCKKKYIVRYGIPVLMDEEESWAHSQKFLGADSFPNKTSSPYRTLPLKIHHFLIAEIIYFSTAVYFLFRFGPKELLKKNWCEEVHRALFYGWRNYFNLVLKSSELVYFRKAGKYITEPSLEIGCGPCYTTNMIFRDVLDSVTFGCEYFMDTYLYNAYDASCASGISPEMFKLIRHYVGGSIKNLPFRPDIFNSVYLVHIVDHIIDIDGLLKEANRIMKSGGYLIISGYSRYVFEHLPGVRLRKFISKKWAQRYKIKRITKENPYRGGIPLSTKNEFYVTGMNIMSVDEWCRLGELYGFNLIDYNFFGKYFSFFADLEYRGYAQTFFLNEFIYSAISKVIEEEKKTAVSEKESTNIILIFKKKNGLS